MYSMAAQQDCPQPSRDSRSCNMIADQGVRGRYRDAQIDQAFSCGGGSFPKLVTATHLLRTPSVSKRAGDNVRAIRS